VLGSVKVLRSVFVLGVITAAYVAANQAEPQVYPAIAYLEAIFAAVGAGCDFLYLVEVLTSCFHYSPPLGT
jgi:hypothetical protein